MKTDLLNKKIIIVEDVPMILAIITKFLANAGFTNISGFTDGAEAWEFFAESELNDEPVDLIFTDLNMPSLDGMEFIEKVKSDEMKGDVKIVVISADHDPLVIDEAMEKGADEYLTKPVTQEDLVEKIDFLFNILPSLEK